MRSRRIIRSVNGKSIQNRFRFGENPYGVFGEIDDSVELAVLGKWNGTYPDLMLEKGTDVSGLNA